jgi:hypothetical protein
MARDYRAEYARAKAAAQARGYSSPRTQRDARKPRDYAIERERTETRARGRGFRNAREQAAFNRTGASNREGWQRDRILAYFGLSLDEFDEIRRNNRNYHNQFAQLEYTAINTYDADRDADVHNWSEYRVGYVLAFHAAIVNPRTNWDSLAKRVKIESGKYIHVRVHDKLGRPLSNKSQYYYLVKYTNIMSQDYYEARYGMTAVRDANNGKVSP